VAALRSPDLLADEPLDRDVALSRTDGDPEILRDVARLILEHIPKWMSAMRDSLARGDSRTLKRLAHTLKSSADNVGAAKGAGAAARLEMLSAEQNLDEARLALAILETEVSRMLPAIARLAAEPSSAVE
jgi:HPt (histidine-containing phosphotransfer) domain-containing protein